MNATVTDQPEHHFWRLHLLRHEVPQAFRNSVVSIGNFDGVHIGHQKLISRARQEAAHLGVATVAITFDPPPAAILRPRVPYPPLSTIPTRARLLRRAGADHVLVVHTDRQLLELDAERFFRSVLLDRLAIRGIVEGPNFTFGKGRSGTAQRLEELGKQHGVQVTIVPPVIHAGQPVSSSRIRALLTAGDVAAAASLLGRPYQVAGLVCAGAGRGQSLGFPTANLAFVETLVPGHGVYACIATVHGDRYPAAVHVGPVPTFGDQTPRVEAHLIDFRGELLGERIELAFVAKIREVARFDSAQSLRSQLLRDVARAKRLVQEVNTPG